MSVTVRLLSPEDADAYVELRALMLDEAPRALEARL